MSIINKLNNYDWSDEEIDNIKYYVKHKITPKFKTNAKRNRFIEKYKHFIIRNNNLIYKPLNLEVIPNDKREETLQQFYNDYKAIGSGKVNLYKKIVQLYINIHRDLCGEFLSKQPEYQINKENRHIVNKPILASSCGERLAIDLVSINNLSQYNNGYNQILTAIDYFSRKVWARPLKNKSKENVLNGIKSIIEEMGITPHIIQSDNGGEFKNYYTIEYYRQNNIKYIFTLPYAPESNGLIENFNKQLRKMFRELFIRNNNLNWVDYLQICCDNKNTQYNRTTKHAPNKLWNQDSFYDNVKNRIDVPQVISPTGITPEEIRIQARENIRDKAKQQIERTKIDELAKND